MLSVLGSASPERWRTCSVHGITYFVPLAHSAPQVLAHNAVHAAFAGYTGQRLGRRLLETWLHSSWLLHGCRLTAASIQP